MAAFVGAAGCGASWPRAQAVGDAEFLARPSAVGAVDRLPVDVQVWGEGGAAADAIAAPFSQTLAGVVDAALARRGYPVAAAIDWRGGYVAPDGSARQAMSADGVAHTAYALSGYGAAQAQVVGPALLVPHLPARLGQATGADATLYVGGWAYAGRPRDSTGEKIVKGVVIGLVVVAAVVVIWALLDGDGGGGGGGGGKAPSGGGGGGGGVGRALGGAGRALGHAAATGARTVGRIGAELGRATLRGLGSGRADAWGRSHTHVEIYAGRPDYLQDPATPRGGPSAIYLEATLVDNRTGRALWHARQRYPADPRRSEDVARAVADLFATLPAR